MKNAPYFPELTEDDIRDLTAFRHELHQHPELSGEERETARRVCDKLADSAPDTVLTDVGGHGIAAIFDSGVPGPTILFRSELDALPIEDLGDIPYRSTVPGKAHLCGHDGHSTILLGLGRTLGRQR
ncbi:MAG: M20/M25/M40 family metallo-hydrolase, partial [Pseudomonadota bacterium]|nr:M20/M25/M40 family metallo-hydrolase [Pseudomonadota bacterium]